MNGKEKKMTKNKQVPIIQYDKNVKEYESDPKKIIRYNRVKLCDFFSHYVEDEGKHSITSEEYKWIDYIHKEVIPSVQLYNSSSVGNLK